MGQVRVSGTSASWRPQLLALPVEITTQWGTISMDFVPVIAGYLSTGRNVSTKRHLGEFTPLDFCSFTYKFPCSRQLGVGGPSPDLVSLSSLPATLWEHEVVRNCSPVLFSSPAAPGTTATACATSPSGCS